MDTLIDENDDWYWMDYFGHLAGDVPDDCWRIGCININRLPEDPDSADHSIFFQDIINYNLDVVLMQEIGLNWRPVGLSRNFQSRLDKHFEPGQTCSRMGWNEVAASSTNHQWGGTGVMAHGTMKHFGLNAGTDKARMGRWTWARFRGKHGVILRVVSIYQPTKTEEEESSVWNQHKTALNLNNNSRNPRQAFMSDLRMDRGRGPTHSRR